MTSDHFAVRVIVATIAAGALMGVGIVGYLSITGTPIPDQLDRLVTLFAGAVIGVLARTSSSTGGAGEAPTAVQVVNDPGEAVPVAETPKPHKS
jgi:hypothetical protein